MKKILALFGLFVTLAGTNATPAQNSAQDKNLPKVTVYYFHPSERCPIDQSVEKNTKTVVQNYFDKEVKNGTLLLRVINTDDKSNAKFASTFDINAQALYIVKTVAGKETRNDLTRVAFDYSLSNPTKFKAGLKTEIEKALK
ncbi:MAG: nitrophenyl compound nitroreductase subunit ArsF family protein [Bacteroidetes bacterium]|nr:nitrophenyl compound nitroreductase subunit ArsF family protein [Bacteroidota bacterium]